jgi:hypothetical protein
LVELGSRLRCNEICQPGGVAGGGKMMYGIIGEALRREPGRGSLMQSCNELRFNVLQLDP